jgi:hypothetical protein
MTKITTSTPVVANPWESNDDTVTIIYGFTDQWKFGDTAVKIGFICGFLQGASCIIS